MLKLFTPETFTNLSLEQYAEYVKGGVRCARIGSDGLFNSWGVFPNDGLVMEFPLFQPSAVIGHFGFKTFFKDQTPATDGTVKYRVSFDEGETWMFASSSDFKEVLSSSDWSVDTEISKAFYALTTIPRSVLVRMNIKGVTSSPIVSGVGLYLRFKYDYDEDLARTIKRWLESNQLIWGKWRQTLLTETDTVTIRSTLIVKQVVSAFNITDDPKRAENILLSSSDYSVTLIARQSEGSAIEVVFQGSVPVILAAEAASVEASLPSFVVTVVDTNIVGSERTGATLKEIVNDHMRFYFSRLPDMKSSKVEVLCLANNILQATNLVNAASRAFGDQFLSAHDLVSLASGEKVNVLYLQPASNEDDPGEELFNRVVRFEALVYDANTDYVSGSGGVGTPTGDPIGVDAVRGINIRMGSMLEAFKSEEGVDP